jgi:hypothetical protein
MNKKDRHFISRLRLILSQLKTETELIDPHQVFIDIDEEYRYVYKKSILEHHLPHENEL